MMKLIIEICFAPAPFTKTLLMFYKPGGRKLQRDLRILLPFKECVRLNYLSALVFFSKDK